MSGNLTNHIELQSFDLYNRIEQIHRQPTAAPENIRAKYILLYKVLEQACYELTAGVTFSFANLFSRLDYICKEKRMTPSDKYAIQTMRRNCNAAMRDDFRPVMEEYLSVSLYELYYCIEKIKSICIIARKLMQKLVENDKMNKNTQMMVDFYVRNDYNRIINKRKRFLPKKKKL